MGKAVKAALLNSVEAQKAAVLAAYYAGNPYSEDERLALRRAEEWLDDLFEASALDFAAMMENDDGEMGHSPDQ